MLASKTDALTKADVFKDMDESLKALQTDHVDMASTLQGHAGYDYGRSG